MNSDSSSDEAVPTSTLNVPSVNLASLRKNDPKKRSQFARATKKLSGKGASLTSKKYRDSSTNSTNVSSVLSEMDSDGDRSDYFDEINNLSSGLPDFRMNMSNDYDASGLNSDQDSEYNQDSNEIKLPQQYDNYNVDSSDEEGREAFPKLSSRPTINEVDIADFGPMKHSESHSSLSKSLNASLGTARDTGRSGSTSDQKGFRGILRRMTLLDSKPTESHDLPHLLKSDAFLGRVLNFSSSPMTGFVSGPTNVDGDKIDEEREIGPQPIEMKPLQFSDLNEEAHQLIFSHVPELSNSFKYREAEDFDSNNNSTAVLLENEKPPATVERSDEYPDPQSTKDHSRTTTASLSEGFFHPNRSLLRPESELVMNDDYFVGDADGYIAPPKHVHAGVLSSLLKLYQNAGESKSTATLVHSNISSQSEDYVTDPKRPHRRDYKNLQNTLRQGHKKFAGKLHGKNLKIKDASLSDEEGILEGEAAKLPSFQNARPKAPRGENLKLGKKLKKRENQKLRITVHIADILQRQRFIIRMCKALMMYGAPTHRLEEYMIMTSRVLEIDGQFVYFPGTMIVAFGDAATRTSEVHLVRCAQGLNLLKLSDTHKIYKDVIHDLSGVEEASRKIEELLKRDDIFSPWMCVLFYGLGSASVCVWGFGGGWLDIPASFAVGLIIGYLQFFLSPKSHLYSSVFEVAASIVVSFISRGLGSIKGGDVFCFGAIAQGSLALILPGYIILCGSLELQSKNLVAGSVRMFYAIIYSLFLGFGITLGAALYGWVDKNATDQTTCDAGHGISDLWRILFVPIFSLCLSLINQSRWTQLPVMTAITGVSYVATYYAGKHFLEVTEFTAAIGAFIIGILGNMYSRLGKGMAVTAMLPAIFVQVPSGIASKGSLLAGVDTANKITNSTSSSSSTDLSSLSFGATMVEVSIGISVGLCAAALVVYPFGKRRTSLFTL